MPALFHSFYEPNMCLIRTLTDFIRAVYGSLPTLYWTHTARTDPIRAVYGPYTDRHRPYTGPYRPYTDPIRTLYGFLPTQYRIYAKIRGSPGAPNQEPT